MVLYRWINSGLYIYIGFFCLLGLFWVLELIVVLRIRGYNLLRFFFCWLVLYGFTDWLFRVLFVSVEESFFLLEVIEFVDILFFVGVGKGFFLFLVIEFVDILLFFVEGRIRFVRFVRGFKGENFFWLFRLNIFILYVILLYKGIMVYL